MNEDLNRLEEKIDGIRQQLSDLKIELSVRDRDLVWIKNTSKVLIPLLIAFGVWVTTNIMELKTNVAALPVLQRDKFERSDDPIE